MLARLCVCVCVCMCVCVCVCVFVLGWRKRCLGAPFGVSMIRARSCFVTTFICTRLTNILIDTKWYD